MAEIDWELGRKDAMWSMFWVARERRNTNADEESLKENVARLIRMTAQKDAGQRRQAKNVDWNALAPTLMNIALRATRYARKHSGTMKGEIP